MEKNLEKTALAFLALAVLAGLFFRLNGLRQNEFFFYDEGYYLSTQRGFAEFIADDPPTTSAQFFRYLQYDFFVSLCMGKPLWFFLQHLRSFWGQFEAFFFSRMLSAAFGILTALVTFLFARRYFQSKETALLAAALLITLPGHVFYSRLGLQEALSGLCLLAGFYFYLFPGRFGIRSILAGIFFALTYFSNYRMFLIPGLVLFAETWLWWSKERTFNVRRYVWSMMTFLLAVMIPGLANDGCHITFIFHWMLRQTASAKEHFDFISLFSYPYVMFRLESVLFGLFFFGNVFFLARKQRQKMLPFVLVILQMAVFSFAHEKGARYMAVVMPFMAMAAAFSIREFLRVPRRSVRIAVAILAGLMLVQHLVRASRIQAFNSDYRESVETILARDPGAKILSTQALVQGLFAPDAEDVKEPPHAYGAVLAARRAGYKYLILGPQVFISHTKNKKRFETRLEDHLQFLLTEMTPIKEYPHFSDAMMERFVFEHNEDLRQSLEFLAANRREGLGKLRVYDIDASIAEVSKRMRVYKMLQQ